MADAREPLDLWPLLPRRFERAECRPTDEPARAVFSAGAGLAALFLLLRWVMPDPALGQEVARLVAVWGCLGGLALVVVLMALLVAAAVVTPMMPIRGPLRDVAIATLDHLMHLALVLTASGVLGLIVFRGTIDGPAGWFAGLLLLLWACHRARLHLADQGAT